MSVRSTLRSVTVSPVASYSTTCIRHQLAAGKNFFGKLEQLEPRRLLSGSALVDEIDRPAYCGCMNCLGTLQGAIVAESTPYGNDVPSGRNPSGDYQIGGRWSNTATNGNTGGYGNPVTLTWGFIADGLMISGANGEPASVSNLQARLNSIYGSSTTWVSLFTQVFDRWSAVSGLSYVYTGLSDDGATMFSSPGVLGVRPDVRIGGHYVDGGYNTLAYNFFPNNGDMVIDTAEFLAGGFLTSTATNSRRLRNVVAHEHGHGIGLEHVIPTNNTKLMEPSASTAFDGPQFDDILAAQALYGDPLEKNGRNETAATATNLGTLGNGNNVNHTPWSTTPVSIANTSDSDYFKFTITEAQNVSFTVAPYGPTYNQGPQDGAASSFNASNQGNLALTLYNTNGTSVLHNINSNGTGSAETTPITYLAPGTYYVKVGISAGSTQAYQLYSTITGSVTINAPSTPVLDPASDTGVSQTDGITKDNTPTFTGTGEVGTIVTLYRGSTALGSAPVAADGTWAITSSTLSDGIHTVYASASIGVSVGPASGNATVTIDTVGLAYVTHAYDYLTTQDVRITLNGNIASELAVAGFTLKNLTTDTITPIDRVIATGSGNVATIQVDALLTTGQYQLTVNADALTDVAGNGITAPLTINFRQLNGDGDNNGSVNFRDLLILTQYYGQSGKGYQQGNYDYSPDGYVGFSDLLIVAQNYGTRLFLVNAVEPSAEKTTAATERKRPDTVTILA